MPRTGTCYCKEIIEAPMAWRSSTSRSRLPSLIKEYFRKRSNMDRGSQARARDDLYNLITGTHRRAKRRIRNHRSNRHLMRRFHKMRQRYFVQKSHVRMISDKLAKEHLENITRTIRSAVTITSITSMQRCALAPGMVLVIANDCRRCQRSLTLGNYCMPRNHAFLITILYMTSSGEYEHPELDEKRVMVEKHEKPLIQC